MSCKQQTQYVLLLKWLQKWFVMFRSCDFVLKSQKCSLCPTDDKMKSKKNYILQELAVLLKILKTLVLVCLVKQNYIILLKNWLEIFRKPTATCFQYFDTTGVQQNNFQFVTKPLHVKCPEAK